MRISRAVIASTLAALVAATGTGASDAAPVALPPGNYELTTQTLLPNLEEALRYATTRRRQCLQAPDAAAFFPLLEIPAFSGCRLEPREQAGDAAHFSLQCDNPHAASGSADFTVAADRITAVLNVKMGGKNMTWSQRVAGPRVGPCSNTTTE